jgi:glycine cleavage system H lipoate-binding protein/ABC-type phosphate transport system substrate-binding protein
MKNISILIIGLSLTLYAGTAFPQSRSDNPKDIPANQAGNNAVKVLSSPELYQLSLNLVNEFNKLNPSAAISLDRFGDNQVQSVEHLSLVSEQYTGSVNDPVKWKMVIGRDVVVPVINARNPMLSLLYTHGISSQRFAQLFREPSKMKWSSIVSDGQNAPIQLIIPDNKEIIACLGEFSKVPVSEISGKLTGKTEDVFAAVQKDIFAIGFSTLNALKAYSQQSGNENIRLLPVDKNGNGRMDTFENIYRNTDEFTHGVWIGKFPATLSECIYAVAPAKPTNQIELAFLTWVLTDGQSLLNANGYCELASIEKQTNATSLINATTNDTQALRTASSPQSWPVILTVLVLAGIFVSIFMYSRKRAKSFHAEQEIQVAPFLVEHAMDVPKGLFFDKTHTWAFMEQDGNVRVGIDDFLQHVTGKLTKIRMKEAGEKVRKGETIMTIMREGKQLNIYAPISGTILAQNEILLEDSAIINSSPFFKGWVYQIEPKNWLRETQFMLMGERYADWLRDEFARLKDFITASIRKDNLVYAHVILQDGGELTDNVLAELGPEVWEDFQTHFIDTSR